MAALSLALVAPAAAEGPPLKVASVDQAFVTAAYEDFLGRRPTGAELRMVATAMAQGRTRDAVLSTLSTSPEWIGSVVSRFYQDTLGRAPDAGGLAYWRTRLQAGRVTVAQVGAQMYASDEYFRGFGKGDTSTWIRDLYAKILGRRADTGGVAHWVRITASHGRGYVAGQMYQSTESRRKRVRQLYDDLLHRGPDSAGLEYWIDKILTVGDLALARNLASGSEYLRKAQDRHPVYVASAAAPAAGYDRAEASGLSNHGVVLGRMLKRVNSGEIGLGYVQVGSGAPTLITPLAGDNNTQLLTVNDDGLVAGCSYRYTPGAGGPGGGIHVTVVMCNAFTYDTRTGRTTDLRPALGVTGVYHSKVDKITSSGTMGGTIDGQPFLFDPTTATRTDIPLLPRATKCYLRDLSNAGIAIGVCIGGDTPRSFVYHAATARLSEMAPLPGDNGIEARAINDAGMVVAESTRTAGGTYTRSAALHDSRTGTSVRAPSDIASPVAINASGSVLAIDRDYDVVRWDPTTGGVVSLAGLNFHLASSELPGALNDRGEVAGLSRGSKRAVVLR